MSEGEPKKTPIFSDEFKLKTSKFTTRAYSDYEGIVSYLGVAIGILLVLLFFWWRIVGPIGGAAYAHMWAETYPGTPIELSAGYHILNTLDLITMFAFWTIFGLLLIILSVIIIKRSNKIKPTTEQPMVPISSIAPKTYSGPGCMYCSSKKIRNGGKDNPDKMYCKSCRRFF